MRRFRIVLLCVFITVCGGPVTDTVLVRPGMYEETVRFFAGKGGILLRGDGPVESIIVASDTVAVSVFGTVLPVRIENLTITGSRLHGGLYFFQAKAEVVGCVIRDNIGPGSCNGVGGGGRIEECDVLVEGCLFENNHSWESPGGLIIWSSRADIRNNVFRDNSSCYGGGLQFYHCEGFGLSVIEGNLFLNNYADEWGGGFFNVDSSPECRFNTFSGNGGEVGAAIWVLGGSPNIHNNIIVDSYEAIHCQSNESYPSSTPVFNDNLCWNISRMPLPSCASSAGMFITDPLFCDAVGGGFGLCADSPAVVDDVVGYGAFEVECDACGEVAVKKKSWGEIKSLLK